MTTSCGIVCEILTPMITKAGACINYEAFLSALCIFKCIVHLSAIVLVLICCPILSIPLVNPEPSELSFIHYLIRYMSIFKLRIASTYRTVCPFYLFK